MTPESPPPPDGCSRPAATTRRDFLRRTLGTLAAGATVPAGALAVEPPPPPDRDDGGIAVRGIYAGPDGTPPRHWLRSGGILFRLDLGPRVDARPRAAIEKGYVRPGAVVVATGRAIAPLPGTPPRFALAVDSLEVRPAPAPVPAPAPSARIPAGESEGGLEEVLPGARPRP